MNRISLVILLAPLLYTNAIGQGPARIVPSNVDQQLREKLESDPGIRAAELAALGNSIATQSGFVFTFAPDGFTESGDLVKYELRTTNGRKYLVSATPPGDHPCGISTEFPVLGATPGSLTLLVNGKPKDVVLPKKFGVDEVALVDAKLRRTLRKWIVPMDSTPQAISFDGTKIYVSSYVHDDVFIEVDSRGRYRYVAKDAAIMLVNAADLTKLPKDKDNDYLGYRRFKSRKYNYTVKFSNPCT